MNAVPAATGFLTYLGYAIHLELQRRQLEAAYGTSQAHIAILDGLQEFKAARALYQSVNP